MKYVYITGESPRYGDIVRVRSKSGILWKVISAYPIFAITNAKGIKRLGTMSGEVSVRAKVAHPSKYILMKRDIL